jgi:hypothetical protein
MRRRAAELVIAALFATGCSRARIDSAADAAATPLDGAGPQVKTYELPAFTVGPGEDKTLCDYVPPDGIDRLATRFVADLSTGGHHLSVFRVVADRAPAPGLAPCGPLDIPQGFDGMLPGAQQPYSEWGLPEGVAIRVGAEHGLYFQAHFINASTTETLPARITYQLTAASPATVRQTAGTLFYSNQDLQIPVGDSSASGACPISQDITLSLVTGHMHEHALSFDAQAGGVSLYHSDWWSDPPIEFFGAPGRTVPAGQTIRWTCAYRNQGTTPLGFGPGLDAEMCVLVGIFYPAVDSGTDYCR